MKFDDLDQRMRVFETAHDLCVVPGLWMVARIDGRSFTRLTKDVHKFEAPFDVRFRDHMVATVEHLMLNTGFRIVYGYTQSDEISLLFHRDEQLFERKERKYNSVLASEAAAVFSLRLGAVASFDCRICQLPRTDLVIDYFRWRHEDAHRNALSAHCYWTLRRDGCAIARATSQLLGMDVSAKNELLFQHGINFAKLPAWQRRGVGVYWEDFAKEAVNPRTGQPAKATRRRLKIDFELPLKDAYRDFVAALVEKSTQTRKTR